mgnify:CR=1 FL=1
MAKVWSLPRDRGAGAAGARPQRRALHQALRIPWRARWFVLTDRRVIARWGVFNRNQAALLLDRVQDASLARPFPLSLIRDYGVKGFKLHPNVQGFYPNDRSAYVLYEAIAESGLPALFHTGQTGVGKIGHQRRLEAAEAYRDGGRGDRAEAEEREAEIIASYMPEQLSDEQLEAIVGDAVAESGASSPQEMGRVMALVMPKVKGQADGKRVSAAVKGKLSP